MNDAHYPWFILVPQVQGVREIHDLSVDDQCRLLQESSTLSRILAERFRADKMNLAALGNIVPQLHIHHVVRYRTDAAWPNPVWGRLAAIPYTREQIAEIRRTLLPLLPQLTAFPA